MAGCRMYSMVWLNGSLMPLHEARISPLDHGLLVGDGVFETLVARNGQLFAVHQHWERLVHSCKVMGLKPVSEEEFTAAMLAVLEANHLPNARVRFTLTSGDGPLGSDRGDSPGTVLVTSSTLNTWPPTERVSLSPWPRLENGALTGVKTTSYGDNVRALAFAKSRGCGEALLANTRGELCEGTGSNIFLVLNGRLVTPPLSSGCLAGVTRKLVIMACAQIGLTCFEEAVPASALAECEEAFLTSSTRDVHPIAEIDGRPLSTPGPITAQVQAVFLQIASNHYT
jgi:branched-chain amino acid aminotransferase